MFGFYSFSENPFSSPSVVSAGEVKTGVAVLNASGAITANGSTNLLGSLSIENSGSIECIGSVIIPGQSLLQGSGNLTSNLSRIPVVLEGVGSLSSSGNFDSNGTIIHGAIATPNVSGELTSDIHVIHRGFATLEASASLGVSESVELDGASLLLDAGTVTANGTLLTPIASSLEASGELSSEVSLIRSSEATIIGSGTISSNGTALVPLNSSIESSGELTSDIHVIHRGFATLEASGSLGVSESVELNGTSLLLDAGTVTANGTLLVPIDASLEASGELSSIGSSAKSSASLLVDSGTVSAKGTLYGSIKSSIESSGELTSDIHVVHGGISELAASGTLGVNESVELNGTSLLLDAGTVSAKGTLLSVSTSSTEASGIITADPSLIIPHDSSLSGSGIVTGISSSIKVSATDISSSGTTTNNGTLILGPLHSIESSGTVDPNGSNLIAGKTSLTSPGVTIVDGTFNPGELTASLSASSSITAQIGLDLESQAIVGNTAKEFLKKTSRPNYKPALPKLSNKDIVVDFPFHEGAGNLRSVSSRRQTGNIGNLSWGRVDGRQSLTSTGTSYSNNRISFDTAGVSLTRSTIVISFKPTSISSNHFLFNLRGTANNNNEIDCYITSNQKINIDIYNGTSKQTITTAVVNLNEWNTLVLTWDNNLKAYLNGSDPVTLGSFVEPAVLGSTFYIAGRTEDNFGFIGSIDHFRLYNKQISDIEAKQLHKNIYKDYSLDYIIPNHYEMTRVTSAGSLMKNSGSNISASGQVISRGSFILAQLKAAFGGLAEINANGSSTPLDISSASLQAAATIAANGILLGELDIVPFTVFINQLEDYNIDVYRTFVKEFNVAKSKTISAYIEKTNITDINIDKILEANLEK